jgi:hypothetical protein
MKIKAGRLFLALGMGLSMAAIVTTITGCVSDRYHSNPNQPMLNFQPTLKSDDHAMPVYTSPAVTPATTNWSNANRPL